MKGEKIDRIVTLLYETFFGWVDKFIDWICGDD